MARHILQVVACLKVGLENLVQLDKVYCSMAVRFAQLINQRLEARQVCGLHPQAAQICACIPAMGGEVDTS